ncbi:MAG: DUF4783 domain-containing protein [Rhodothermales bacterium]|nr:DUF4783 domain-containing protein [Rhodothermales bacterium]
MPGVKLARDAQNDINQCIALTLVALKKRQFNDLGQHLPELDSPTRKKGMGSLIIVRFAFCYLPGNVYKVWFNMRMLVLILLLIMAAAPATVSGQKSADELMDRIEQAVRDGDVDGIIAVSARRIDVSIFGEGKNYSKAQAEFVLDEFFGTHSPTSFRFTASSKTTNGRFAEGLLSSVASRKPLRVYVRLQKRADMWEVREFLVERQRR